MKNKSYRELIIYTTFGYKSNSLFTSKKSHGIYIIYYSLKFKNLVIVTVAIAPEIPSKTPRLLAPQK